MRAVAAMLIEELQAAFANRRRRALKNKLQRRTCKHTLTPPPAPELVC